jgi:AbrB family looped-hinge helix DNA binding protein
MPEARVTSKGQVTIPKAVRERLRIEEGDTVSFDVQDDGSVALKARNRPVESLFGILTAKTRVRGVAVRAMDPATGDGYRE